jgi:L-2-hydroxyglutarate oxidase
MYDYLIVGGGIVGVATALTLLQRHPGASIALVEKEAALAVHQSGHNSGVIHAGVYYAPGSLKARLCKEGRAETIAFCARHAVRYRVTGKLLVATSALEVQRAQALRKRCQANGIRQEWLDAAQLASREPHVAGLGAIHVPMTGIADYVAMTHRMAELFRELGGEVRLGEEVVHLSEEANQVSIETRSGRHLARRLIVCAGIQADRLARIMGLGGDIRMVPFRGEYFRLGDSWRDRFRHLIYPIPDPELPFLGIHITLMIDGSVTVGPNAVVGFAREGYRKFAVNGRDLLDVVGYSGFWKAMRPHWRSAASELLNSASRRLFLQLCRRYCPSLQLGDLEPHPAGIRAQAIWSDGRLEHDFVILNSRRSVHVCNAPSPAATSAIPIARHIADAAAERMSA